MKQVYGSIASDSHVSSKKLKVDNGAEFFASKKDIMAMKLDNRPQENYTDWTYASYVSLQKISNNEKVSGRYSF